MKLHYEEVKMNKIKYFLLLGLFVGFLVNGLIAKEKDIFAGLKVNDHVAITIKNGHTFSGIVKSIEKTKIVLDISYDSPDLKGKITFYKDNIKTIESLMSLTETDKKEIISAKNERQKNSQPDNNESNKEVTETGNEEPKPTPEEKPRFESERERLLALLEQFPPNEGWGIGKKDDIMQKVESLRSDAEKEFLKVFDDWTKGLALKEKDDFKALLEKFPPEKGWGKEKYQEITTRIARIRVGPTAEENEFVTNFANWEKALEEKKKEEAAEEKKESEQEAEQQSPSSESEPQQ